MATTPRKRLPRAEREQRMLDAAEQVFGEHPFGSASMEEIAERSGITKALLYQYFGSKEGLYEATVERARAQLFRALEASVAAVPAGTPRLAAFVDGFFDYVEANRGHWWLLYGEASSAAVNAMRERNAELIGQLLAEDLGDARLPPDAIAVLAHLLVGAGEQVGRWWVAHPEVPEAQVKATFRGAASGAIAAVVRDALSGS